MCVNFPGGFNCTCAKGHFLASNGKNCTGSYTTKVEVILVYCCSIVNVFSSQIFSLDPNLEVESSFHVPTNFYEMTVRKTIQ